MCSAHFFPFTSAATVRYVQHHKSDELHFDMTFEQQQQQHELSNLSGIREQYQQCNAIKSELIQKSVLVFFLPVFHITYSARLGAVFYPSNV